MNTTRRTVALSAVVILTAAAINFAGPVTPPAGPIAPTMKTIADVEPRTAISQATTPGSGQHKFIVSQPGSYYLTGDVAVAANMNGIMIAAPDVTIDLNGFRIYSATPGAASSGILTPGDGTDVSGCVVKNGSVTGFSELCVGLEDGSRIEKVAARASGSSAYGLTVSDDGLILDCTASNGQVGFSASYGSRIEGCTASNNSQIGISAGTAIVRNCTARGNGDYGIYTYGSAVIEHNLLISNDPTSGAGIYISGNGARVEGNSVTDSRWGIMLSSSAADNVVAHNRVRTGTSTAYAMGGQAPGSYPNNHVAQIITNPASPFTTTNPLANIEH